MSDSHESQSLEQEVLSLVSQLAEEPGSEAALARLDELVTSSAVARRAYLAAIDLIAGLEWGAVGQRSPVDVAAVDSTGGASLDDAVHADVDLAEIFGVELSPHSVNRTAPAGRTIVLPLQGWILQKPGRSLVAVAAVYYGLALGLFYSLALDSSAKKWRALDNSVAASAVETTSPVAEVSLSQSSEESSGALPETSAKLQVAPKFTARVVAVRDAQFGDVQVLHVGQQLDGGRIELLAGMVELEFGTGARAVIAAPAILEVASHQRAKLLRGALSLRVPASATGFTVATPTAEVVDLGTEFEVAVAESGETAVSVLLGTVDVLPTAGPASPYAGNLRRRLTSGGFQRVGHMGLVIDEPHQRPGKFVQAVPHRPYGPELVEQGGSFAPQNLARLPEAKPFASSCLVHPLHQIEHLNDGSYGNSRSWISDGVGRQFAGVSFDGKYIIDSFAFGRDNGGDLTADHPDPLADRCAGTYTLQVTTVENPNELTPDSDWHEVGTIEHPDREVDIAIGRFKPYARHRYRFRPLEATGIRLLVPGSGVAIDEIEVYPAVAQEDANQK